MRVVVGNMKGHGHVFAPKLGLLLFDTATPFLPLPQSVSTVLHMTPKDRAAYEAECAANREVFAAKWVPKLDAMFAGQPDYQERVVVEVDAADALHSRLMARLQSEGAAPAKESAPANDGPTS